MAARKRSPPKKKRSQAERRRRSSATRKRAKYTKSKRAAKARVERVGSATKRARKARVESKPRKAKKSSRAQLAALTRARRRFEAESTDRRRQQLIATMRRSGYSDASIRSHLGWFTRRRKIREESGKRPSRAQLAAVTRARGRFESEPTKPKTIAHRQNAELRRQQFIATMRRAGYSDAAIRAELRRIKRRKKTQDVRLGQVQAEELGLSAPLEGRFRENWYVLRGHMTEEGGTPEFRRYIERAEELGYSYDEAVDRWFSPQVE